MNIITMPELASYLDLTETALRQRPRAASVLTRTNRLVTEKWANPTDPVPSGVIDVALEVAAQALRYDPARPPVESTTKTHDGTSRTDRFAKPAGTSQGRDVYLTVEQLAVLQPGTPTRRPRTIRTVVPGAGV